MSGEAPDFHEKIQKSESVKNDKNDIYHILQLEKLFWDIKNDMCNSKNPETNAIYYMILKQI